jgi:hypothetical protein
VFAFVVIWIICAIVSGVIASSRGLSGCLYSFLGFIIGPFGVLMACVMPSPNRVDAVYARVTPPVRVGPPQMTRKCPECLSDIPAAARVCRYCQRESQPTASIAIQQLQNATGDCYNGQEHNWVWSEVYKCWRCADCYTYQR